MDGADTKELKAIFDTLNEAIKTGENVYGYSTFTNDKLRSIRSKLISLIQKGGAE